MRSAPLRRRRLREGEDPSLRVGYLAVGALALAACAAALYVAFTAPTRVPGKSYYELTVQLDDLANLAERGSDVRIAGKRVGQTLNGRLVDGVPTIDLQLEPDTAPLPADTTVKVRPRGLLGAQYLDLKPGSSPITLPDGSVLAAGGEPASVQVPDLIDTFDRPRRRALGELLRGFGGGLAGRGEGLNRAFADAPHLLRHSSRALRPLLARSGATSRFVAGADALMGGLEPVREQLANGFGELADAAEPFAAERAGVGELLEIAPDSLAAIERALARTDPLLERTTRFADATAAFAERAPRALVSVDELLRRGRRPLAAAKPVLARARAAVPPTLELTAALDPTLPRLGETLEHSREPVRILGRYGCDIKRYSLNWREFLRYGHHGRTGELGPKTVLRVAPVLPGGVPNAEPALAGSGINSYPEPCTSRKTGR